MTESPFSTQGWNRYAYVGNSPLNFADPSGYCFAGCLWQAPFKALGAALRRTPILGNILQVAAAAICTAGTFGACSPIAAAIISSAVVAGLASGDLGQALKAGLITATTAVAFNIAGSLTSGLPVANIAAHAAIGCASAVASGRKCGPAALSGAVGSFASNILPADLGFQGNVVAHAVVGGLASVAGGGKFRNGAVTAAFGYLFNWCVHNASCSLKSSNPSPGIPDSLARSLNCVESRVTGFGDDSLIERYSSMSVKFEDKLTGGTFAAADYAAQSITFFKDIGRLSGSELNFVVGHEFGHLSPENKALAPRTWQSEFDKVKPNEAHADAFSRRILGIGENPGIFKDLSRRH